MGKNKKKKTIDPAELQKAKTKRLILTVIRWSAWIVVLSVIITQFSNEMLDEKLSLGLFVIGGLLYAISVVLEQKYKW